MRYTNSIIITGWLVILASSLFNCGSKKAKVYPDVDKANYKLEVETPDGCRYVSFTGYYDALVHKGTCPNPKHYRTDTTYTLDTSDPDWYPKWSAHMDKLEMGLDSIIDNWKKEDVEYWKPDE